jgi:hypothetical protein
VWEQLHFASLNPLDDACPDLLVSAFGFDIGLAECNDGSPGPTSRDQPGLAFPIDWNADGMVDVVTTEVHNPCSLDESGFTSIHVNDGHAQFTTVFHEQFGHEIRNIAADMDRDGDEDLITLRTCGVGVRVHPNPSIEGPLQSAWSTYFSGSGRDECDAITTGDLNGDGFPDIVVGHAWIERLVVILNDGSGRAGKEMELPLYTGELSTRVVCADVNADGLDDVLFESHGLTLLLSRGDGSFEPELRIPVMVNNAEASRVCAVADIDGDGYSELMVNAGPTQYGYRGRNQLLTYRNRLAPPQSCPADHNRDDAVDSRDLVAFLNDWAAGRIAADCDGSGQIDASDVACFLTVWQAGCS